MQISFVSFFSCLANRTSRYQKIDASWLVNQLHAPYIQCAVGELYTVMHNQKFHSEIQTFHPGLKFIYSEKATKFCEIFPLLLTGGPNKKAYTAERCKKAYIG